MDNITLYHSHLTDHHHSMQQELEGHREVMHNASNHLGMQHHYDGHSVHVHSTQHRMKSPHSVAQGTRGAN